MVTWTEDDASRARTAVLAAVEGLPGVEATDLNGHTALAVRGKRFGWLEVDHHGDGRLGLCVKAEPAEQAALVAADPQRFYVPAYLGVHGWVGVLVDPESRPDWEQVEDLLERAWRRTAGVRAVRALDEGRS